MIAASAGSRQIACVIGIIAHLRAEGFRGKRAEPCLRDDMFQRAMSHGLAIVADLQA